MVKCGVLFEVRTELKYYLEDLGFKELKVASGYSEHITCFVLLNIILSQFHMEIIMKLFIKIPYL
jgi:hypothetical protein